MRAWGVAVGVVFAFASTFVGSVYVHRSLTHRQVCFSPRFDRFLWFASVWFVGLHPRSWVAVHRIHHRHSDTPLDLHSPRNRHGLDIIFRSGRPMRRLDPEVAAAIAGDIAPSSRVACYLGPLIPVSVVALAGGVPTAGAAMASWYLTAKLTGGGVATWCHKRVTAAGIEFAPRDRPILALVTWGEGLHKAHHERPRSPDLGRDRHLDPGYLAIAVLCRLGLAKLPAPGFASSAPARPDVATTP